MTTSDNTYARIREMEELPFFELTCNDQSELGRALLGELFQKEKGYIRKSTDLLPIVYLELNGKRYRFQMNSDSRMDMGHSVLTLKIGFYGGRPDET